MSDTQNDGTTVEQPVTVHTFNGNRAVAWTSEGAVTADQFDSSSDDARTVAQPDGALLGETSADRASTTGAAVDEDDLSEIEGKNAGELVAWMQEAGDDEAEGQRRAGIVWTAETQRSGGVRKSVEEEVDRHLTSDPG